MPRSPAPAAIGRATVPAFPPQSRRHPPESLSQSFGRADDSMNLPPLSNLKPIRFRKNAPVLAQLVKQRKIARRTEARLRGCNNINRIISEGTMNKRLSGKRALVTGGSRGIGAAIAKRLATEGADVALTYTSAPQKAEETVKALQAVGVKARAIKADSADAAALTAAVEEAAAALGGLDILVNSAGIIAV